MIVTKIDGHNSECKLIYREEYIKGKIITNFKPFFKYNPDLYIISFYGKDIDKYNTLYRIWRTGQYIKRLYYSHILVYEKRQGENIRYTDEKELYQKYLNLKKKKFIEKLVKEI